MNSAEVVARGLIYARSFNLLRCDEITCLLCVFHSVLLLLSLELNSGSTLEFRGVSAVRESYESVMARELVATVASRA